MPYTTGTEQWWNKTELLKSIFVRKDVYVSMCMESVRVCSWLLRHESCLWTSLHVQNGALPGMCRCYPPLYSLPCCDHDFINHATRGMLWKLAFHVSLLSLNVAICGECVCVSCDSPKWGPPFLHTTCTELDSWTFRVLPKRKIIWPKV